MIPRIDANPATKNWGKGLPTSTTTVYTASTKMENWPKRLAHGQLGPSTQAAYAAQKPTPEIAGNATKLIVGVAASAKSRNAKSKTSKLSTNINPARLRRTLREGFRPGRIGQELVTYPYDSI